MSEQNKQKQNKKKYTVFELGCSLMISYTLYPDCRFQVQVHLFKFKFGIL